MSENLQEKWAPVLEHADLPKIEDSYKRAVTSVILENQERAIQEERGAMNEALGAGTGSVAGAPGGVTATAANWDPILISLVRRAMPNLVAYDICGVQPMTGPTGLIFAMKPKYSTQGSNDEPAFQVDTNAGFSGSAASAGTTGMTDGNGNGTLEGNEFLNGAGFTTADAETRGDSVESLAADDGSTAQNIGEVNPIAEMAFSIDKVTVTARSRALKAEYTMELAQDLKAIHGLDAETELANILSTEILAEINREVVRTIYGHAKAGAQVNTTTAGTFDLDTDSNGRWSVEKFKGLLYQLERDANAIGQQTRRGKGNIIICSADVASALQMAGVLDYAPALATNLNVDDTGNTFAGVLNGKFKVYVDPYSANVSASQFYVAGYKGTSPYDSGIFYCPYVPLQMVRAVGQDSFQPKIGFKTRYGMVANPFATSNGAGAIDLTSPAAGDQNVYYRRVKVTNIM